MSNRTLPNSKQQTRPKTTTKVTASKTAVKSGASKTAAKATASKPTTRKGNYQKQTARLEGRRDGTPLLFGWGKHLTRAQKSAYQHRAAYSFFGIVVAAMVIVGVFGWFQQNVLIPNQSIATVNGVGLSQDSYRKLLAYDAQVQWNALQSQLKEYNALQPQVQKGDPNASAQNQLLLPQIQTSEANYSQASITAGTAQELVEDALIQQGAQTFEQHDHVSASKFTPTADAVTKALDAFKKAFPAGETYQGFLSKNDLSNSDVRWAIALHLRRDLMQTYLASTYSSPTRQAHVLRIEVATAKQAETLRDDIINKHADWTTLVKQDSLDANTKDSGGDMGWIAKGTSDAAIENWALDPSRKVNDISPVIRDTSGTFDIVKVIEIDPNRGLDNNTLSNAQQNALSHWLEGAKVLPSNQLTKPDTDMVNATRNLPVQPSLSATLPQVGSPPSMPGAGAPTAP